MSSASSTRTVNVRRLNLSSGLLVTLLTLLVLFAMFPIIQAANDDWQMFHHDLQHSGYSTSTAPKTKDRLWDYTTGGSLSSSPAVVGGKIYVGSTDNKVYCLDALTGALIWNFTTGGSITSSPAVANGSIYVGSTDNKVYCLDALTGALIWNFTTGGSITSSPAVANGSIYVGSFDRNIYCLNASTGATIWNYSTGEIVPCSPAVAYGNVYAGSGDRNVYCLNASTGAFVWNFTTGGGVFSSPALADSNVYVGSFGGKVYCLDAFTGAPAWNYTTGGLIASSPAIAYGNLYVDSADQKVYCLGPLLGISILSPESKTYAADSMALTFTTNKPTAWIGYSLDGQTNVTIIGNTTLTTLSDGTHELSIYANDTNGRMGVSTVHFTIDTTPPNIVNVFQNPSQTNVSPQDIVQVNATVTDYVSGVREVTLNYTSNSVTWTNFTMSNLEGNVWNASIPAFPYGTNVTYIIVAQDNAGNAITTLTMGYEFQYQVIPEFPALTIILPLFMISTLLAVAFHRRKQLRHQN
jgi:hypothetical protein